MARMLLLAVTLPMLAEAGMFDTVCSIVPVPVVCSGSGGQGGGHQEDPRWCPGSSCKSPFIACNPSHGETTCVSKGMLSMGVCGCTQPGFFCSGQGVCQLGGAGGGGGGYGGGGGFGHQRLFEEPEGGPVIKEDVVTPLAVLACLAAVTLLGAVVIVRRVGSHRAAALGSSESLADNVADEELLLDSPEE